jgi:hypothetical protein
MLEVAEAANAAIQEREALRDIAFEQIAHFFAERLSAEVGGAGRRAGKGRREGTRRARAGGPSLERGPAAPARRVKATARFAAPPLWWPPTSTPPKPAPPHCNPAHPHQPPGPCTGNPSPTSRYPPATPPFKKMLTYPVDNGGPHYSGNSIIAAESFQTRQLEAYLKVGHGVRARLGVSDIEGRVPECWMQMWGLASGGEWRASHATRSRGPCGPAAPRAPAPLQLAAFACQSPELLALRRPPPARQDHLPRLTPAAGLGGAVRWAQLLDEAAAGVPAPGLPGLAQDWLPADGIAAARLGAGLEAGSRGGETGPEGQGPAAGGAPGEERWRRVRLPEAKPSTHERCDAARGAAAGLWALEMEARGLDWASPRDRWGGAGAIRDAAGRGGGAA